MCGSLSLNIYFSYFCNVIFYVLTYLSIDIQNLVQIGWFFKNRKWRHFQCFLLGHVHNLTTIYPWTKFVFNRKKIWIFKQKKLFSLNIMTSFRGFSRHFRLVIRGLHSGNKLALYEILSKSDDIFCCYSQRLVFSQTEKHTQKHTYKTIK